MKSKEFLSTRKVAELTGLSLGSVQKMVDVGVFSYYLTLGGHRRITMASVEAYLRGREKQLARSWVKEQV
jgi:excisionase family DNA binding protein